MEKKDSFKCGFLIVLNLGILLFYFRQALDYAEFNHRPALVEMHRKLLPITDHFVDDHQPTQDLRDITLRSFFKGVTKK